MVNHLDRNPVSSKSDGLLLDSYCHSGSPWVGQSEYKR